MDTPPGSQSLWAAMEEPLRQLRKRRARDAREALLPPRKRRRTEEPETIVSEPVEPKRKDKDKGVCQRPDCKNLAAHVEFTICSQCYQHDRYLVRKGTRGHQQLCRTLFCRRRAFDGNYCRKCRVPKQRGISRSWCRRLQWG